MKRRMLRAARGRVAVIAAGLLVAVGSLAVLPAASASASSDLTAWFSQDPDTALQSCSTPGDFTYPGAAIEVYNPCSGRVWIHYTSGSGVAAYCVNPDGGLAYDLPIKWAGGDTTDMQLTSNTAQCDAGNTFEVFSLSCGCTPLQSPYNCTMNLPPIYTTSFWIYELMPVDCNFRIWLHQGYTSNGTGTGNSFCIDPGLHQVEGTYAMNQYTQVQTTDNQAPCSAGGPPYSI